MPTDLICPADSAFASRRLQELLVEQKAVAERVIFLNEVIAGRLESTQQHQEVPEAHPQRQEQWQDHRKEHQQGHQQQPQQDDQHLQVVVTEQQRALFAHHSNDLEALAVGKALSEPLISAPADVRASSSCERRPSPTNRRTSWAGKTVALDFPQRRGSAPARRSPARSQSTFTRSSTCSWALSDSPHVACRQLANNATFVNFTLGVIVFNTLWIAVDTDYNHADVLCKAPVIFQVVNNLCCTFFVFELIVRFLALKHKGDLLRDKWLLFDLVLVLQMVWETWVQVVMYLVMKGSGSTGTGGRNGAMRGSSALRIFRIFRLARVFRMSRLLRIIPELMVYVKGMMVAMRSVFAILIMLLLVIYVFAIIFTQMLWDADVPGGTFGTVPRSMRFLLHQVLCGFDSDYMEELISLDGYCYILLVVYWLVASLTIMNMLIGVLCDVMASVSETEKEEVFAQMLSDELIHMAELFDDDGNNSISEDEFDAMMASQSMLKIFTTLGVDTDALVDFIHWEYNERGIVEISFKDFQAMVIQFRGSKHATVRDVVFMRKYMSTELADLERSLARLHNLP